MKFLRGLFAMTEKSEPTSERSSAPPKRAMFKTSVGDFNFAPCAQCGAVNEVKVDGLNIGPHGMRITNATCLVCGGPVRLMEGTDEGGQG